MTQYNFGSPCVSEACFQDNICNFQKIQIMKAELSKQNTVKAWRSIWKIVSCYIVHVLLDENFPEK